MTSALDRDFEGQFTMILKRWVEITVFKIMKSHIFAMHNIVRATLLMTNGGTV